MKKINNTRPVKTAVLPVAGLGTRILPATKAMPKEMLTVIDKPLIQYAVEECLAAGIEKFVFIIGRGKGAIEDHFDAAPALTQVLERSKKWELLDAINACTLKPEQAIYIRQMYPLGLGHAISCAKNIVNNEPFAVILPDDFIVSHKPCIGQLIDAYHETGGNIIAVMDVPKEQVNRYGILEINEKQGNIVDVKSVVEKPSIEKAPSTTAIVGRYVLNPSIFDFIDAPQKETLNEIQLTDALGKNIPTVPLHGVYFEGDRFDCGSKVGYIEAILDRALDRDDIRDDIIDLIQRHICIIQKP